MLKRLFQHFDPIAKLPVEVHALRDQLIACGCQDEIVFVSEEMDESKLFGVFYQYKRRDGVYADPQLCTLIVYNSVLSPEWQRVVCAKELMHILDAPGEKTRTHEDVKGLIEKVVGPLSDGKPSVTDFMALRDQLALYPALALLFPDAARAVAVQMLRDGTATVEQIAKWAQLPPELMPLLLSDQWPSLKAVVVTL